MDSKNFNLSTTEKRIKQIVLDKYQFDFEYPQAQIQPSNIFFQLLKFYQICPKNIFIPSFACDNIDQELKIKHPSLISVVLKTRALVN